MALQTMSVSVQIVSLREDWELLCQDPRTTAQVSALTVSVGAELTSAGGCGHPGRVSSVCAATLPVPTASLLHNLMNDPVSLGGANVIVQIDELLFRH